jgi:polyphosphate kinase
VKDIAMEAEASPAAEPVPAAEAAVTVKTSADASEVAPSTPMPGAEATAPTPTLSRRRHTPSAAEIRQAFETGAYPYVTRMRRQSYEAQKAKLQAELLKVQRWVAESGQKIVILFEGRDAAGKGGTIKRFMEHLNPREARVVALNKPTDEERGQWFFQRYVRHLPTAGEIVFFDRSWYNRAGVERVMGFCEPSDYLEFMRQTPDLERMLARSGIRSTSTGSRSRARSSAAASPAARPIRSSSGSFRRSTGRASTSGTTTPRRRRRCSSTRTPPTRPGRSSSPTTRSARG